MTLRRSSFRLLALVLTFGVAALPTPVFASGFQLVEQNASGLGNAFAGQYDSVFCVNQGPREKRLASLLDAVRQVYASTLSDVGLHKVVIFPLRAEALLDEILEHLRRVLGQ